VEQTEKQENAFLEALELIDSMEPEVERQVSSQLHEELRAVVKAAKASGKAAKLVITITAQPKEDRRITLGASHKSTLPKPPSSGVTLYADEDGGIHKRDPLQVEIPFKKSKHKEPAQS
jgi:hypothetical protein